MNFLDVRTFAIFGTTLQVCTDLAADYKKAAAAKSCPQHTENATFAVNRYHRVKP